MEDLEEEKKVEKEEKREKTAQACEPCQVAQWVKHKSGGVEKLHSTVIAPIETTKGETFNKKVLFYWIWYKSKIMKILIILLKLKTVLERTVAILRAEQGEIPPSVG